jgi:putative transposase
MGRTTRAGQGGRSSYNWKAALNQFDLMFPGRLDRA